MITILPYTQMLRLRRIVDQEHKVNDALHKMIENFQKRGYPKHIIETHKQRVKQLKRSEGPNIKRRVQGSRIPLVTTYKDLSEKVGGITDKYWPVIQNSFKHLEEFKPNH